MKNKWQLSVETYTQYNDGALIVYDTTRIRGNLEATPLSRGQIEPYPPVLVFHPDQTVELILGGVNSTLGIWQLSEDKKFVTTTLERTLPIIEGGLVQKYYPNSEIVEINQGKLILRVANLVETYTFSNHTSDTTVNITRIRDHHFVAL